MRCFRGGGWAPSPGERGKDQTPINNVFCLWIMSTYWFTAAQLFNLTVLKNRTKCMEIPTMIRVVIGVPAI